MTVERLFKNNPKKNNSKSSDSGAGGKPESRSTDRVDGGRDHNGHAAGSSMVRPLGPNCKEISSEAAALHPVHKVEHAPVIHVVRGMGRWLPFLADEHAAPLICLSDWQFEKATQRLFWEQALPIMETACGREALARALMLVAGDMASAGNELRGTSSDAAPDLTPFTSCLGPEGAMFFVYGNHDDEVQDVHHNANRLPQLLADGAVIDCGRTKGESGKAADASGKQARWRKTSKDMKPGGLLLGGVHGIPSSQEVKSGSLWKKRPRDVYFRHVRKVCSEADIVVLHSNPQLPGQKEIDGPDAPKIYDTFMEGGAKLLVHGHMHTQEVVTVIGDFKVVVNSDCRVVVFVPGNGDVEEGPCAGEDDDVLEEAEINEPLLRDSVLENDHTGLEQASPTNATDAMHASPEPWSEGCRSEASEALRPPLKSFIMQKRRWNKT